MRNLHVHMRNIIGKGVILALFLSVAFFSFPASVFAAKSKSVALDSENFPDAIFLSCLSVFDLDQNGTLSSDEISKVTEINVDNKRIESLSGIEYFTELTRLTCDSNDLTELDLSENVKLKDVHCAGNDLTELDLTKNPKLQYLFVENNRLTSLTLPRSSSLFAVYCFNNDLESLDTSKLSNLQYLNCMNNKLTELNLTKNKSLLQLYCFNNRLTELDLSQNKNLNTLWCSDNDSNLEISDLSKHQKLVTVISDCRLDRLAYFSANDHDTSYRWEQSGSTLYYKCIWFSSQNQIVNQAWMYHKGNWYYIGKQNAVYTNKWLSYKGKQYYFNKEGIMLTNTTTPDGFAVGSDGAADIPEVTGLGWVHTVSGWYYYKADGTTLKGWNKIGGDWYYFDTNTGKMQTGWNYTAGNWYYLSDSGKMVTRWANIKGKWYYFDAETGIMLSNTYSPDGYYLTESGSMGTAPSSQQSSTSRPSTSGTGTSQQNSSQNNSIELPSDMKTHSIKI